MQRLFDVALTELLKKSDISISGDGAALVVAVSGGVDSMCLANLCKRSSLPLRLVVAHCNFSLRGSESDADEALVREWGKNNGVRVLVKGFDTVCYAREHGISIEMAARELRYGWFAQVCRETGIKGVLVAHNANDNAETLLLNLVRGTGLRGLTGMKASSPIPYSGCADEGAQRCEAARRSRDSSISYAGCTTEDAKRGEMQPCGVLLRPLLGFSRKQIEGYARANGIKWREDRTNTESEFKRNKLRNEVFPLLESLNPSLVKTLGMEMRWFADAAAILEEWGTGKAPQRVEHGETLSTGENESVRLRIGDILSHNHWPYLLYLKLEPYGFHSATLAKIEDLLRNSDTRTLSGKTFRSPTHTLDTSSTELIIVPNTGGVRAVTDIEIHSPGTYGTRGRQIIVEILDASEILDATKAPDNPEDPDDVKALDEAKGQHDTKDSDNTEALNVAKAVGKAADRVGCPSLRPPKGSLYFDADALPFPFTIRSRREGDWLRPLGMKGRKKKVSDLFTDLKYDFERKNDALFVCRPADLSSNSKSDTPVCPTSAAEGESAPDAVCATPRGLSVVAAGPAKPIKSAESAVAGSEGSHILALLGERIDESVKVTPSTTKILVISLL